MKKIILSFFTILLIAGVPVFSLDVPPLAGPVNDLAGILNSQEKLALQDFLNSVDSQTGVQLAVLTLPSLDGDSLESFSFRTAEQWKLGEADKDNGILLIVVMDDRSIRIEVGYGLEGLLTDMKSGLIIRNVIVPQFQRGNFGQGIIEGSRNIVGIATDNADIVTESVKNPGNDSEPVTIPVIFFIIWFIIIIGLGTTSKSKRRNYQGPRGPSIGGGLSGGSGFGGGSSGGGGFSGGGGSFGGGGASGKW